MHPYCIHFMFIFFLFTILSGEKLVALQDCEIFLCATIHLSNPLMNQSERKTMHYLFPWIFFLIYNNSAKLLQFVNRTDSILFRVAMRDSIWIMAANSVFEKRIWWHLQKIPQITQLLFALSKWKVLLQQGKKCGKKNHSFLYLSLSGVSPWQ